MKLTVNTRDKAKKREAKRIRREGNIPAVLYAPTQEAELIVVDGVGFANVLRTLKQGQLATTKFSFDHNGKTRHAIVKDIQYHPTTYHVLHLDFEELHDHLPVTVQVPIQCVGVAECAGVKAGGVLRQVMRQVKVRCLPNAIPTEFKAEVANLGMMQSLRLSQLAVPQGVELLAKPNDAVVVVGKR